MLDFKSEINLKKIKKKETILIILIFILGFYLRIYKLSSKSLWRDEIWTVEYSEKSLQYAIYKSAVDIKPPLYYSLIKFSIYFGKTPFVVRLPSAVFGVLSILLIYRIGSRFFGTNTALLSAFLVSISPLHIAYSQFARNYSMLTFFSLLSLYFLSEILVTDKSIAWLYFTISNILVVYTHYIGFFVLLAEAGFIIFITNSKKDRGLFKKFLLSFIITGASFVPWTYYAFLQRNGWIKNKHFRVNTKISFMPYIFYKYSIGLRRTTMIDRRLIILFAAPIFFVTFLNGAYTSLKDHKLENYLPIAYIFIPYFATFIFSFFFKWNLFFFRFLNFIIPIYLMYIAHGIQSIKNKKIAIMLLFSIVILHVYLLYDYYFLINPISWYYSVGL